MSNIQDRVFQNLSPLLGLNLSVARHAGNVRLLHFGGISGGTDQCGQYALHLQCPWRLETSEMILTGLYDWYIPADTDANTDDDWDAANGGSLQEAVLRELMGDQTGLSRSIVNRTDRLVVTQVSADTFGGFSLDLTEGVRLSVFPSGSRGEQWRVFQPDTASEHFVVGGTLGTV
jgi:hypothetical protein